MLGWFSAIFASMNGNGGRKRPAASHRKADRRTQQRRRAIFEIVEEGPSDHVLPTLVDVGLVALIVVNIVAVCLETVPEYEERHGTLFAVIDIVSVAIFTVEYIVRLWVAPEHLSYRGMPAGRARVRYALTPYAIIDLLAILPFYLSFIVPWDLRLLRVFRLIRFFKLARYSTGLRSLGRAVEAEWRALMACLIIMVGLILTAGALMYAAERAAQPDVFGSIPQALWWAVVTLTTVGYGDVVPVTPHGKALGGVVMLFGLAMFALPLGIVATAFAQEVHRREFVVTWSMIARVPLFSSLEAGEIAEIMGLLTAHAIPPGGVIVRRGEPADTMYFIASGEVEVHLKDMTVRLNGGDFFGEIAVLKKARRSATVSAVTRTNLLALGADDFHNLLEQRPEIAERVRKVTEARLSKERVVRGGDIISEELDLAEERGEPTPPEEEGDL